MQILLGSAHFLHRINYLAYWIFYCSCREFYCWLIGFMVSCRKWEYRYVCNHASYLNKSFIVVVVVVVVIIIIITILINKIII